LSVRNIALASRFGRKISTPTVLQRWTIPSGRYARRMIADYHTNIPAIGDAFAEMRRRPDYDPSRPCVEYYRSQDEVYVMVPVQ
jgi:hypothetical protein